MKRFERPLLGYLTHEEIEAVLDAPDGTTRCGQRDRVMLATLYNTGARVSELISLAVGNVVLGRCAYVHLNGKGRKATHRAALANHRKLPAAVVTYISTAGGPAASPLPVRRSDDTNRRYRSIAASRRDGGTALPDAEAEYLATRGATLSTPPDYVA